MAQACNNIGKELSLTVKQSSPILIKQRKSNSPQEGKKSLKRLGSSSISPIPSTKKMSVSQSSMFDSLFFHHLNKIFSSSYNYSSFVPSFHQSPYFMDSMFSSPFVCNWMDSNIQDGFCGKRFRNHLHLLEHLWTEHTSIKSSYSSTSID
jgi:hypothetical protein